MLETLLRTKLFIPQRRLNLVTRTKLLDTLNQAKLPGGKCILVSAPAGYGKTSLIVDWIYELGWPTGWYSLDQGDNQARIFLSYLIAAVQGVMPSLGKKAEDLLSSAFFEDSEIVASLVNDLAVQNQPFLLVLDDYQAIQELRIHQILRLLIDSFPATGRLILISREDPPIPLARLRGSGQLIELRQAQLIFTQEEAALFLRLVMGLQIPNEQVAVLEERTEGWIAGLQLAGLALQNIKDQDQFIQSFSGSHYFILDYLIEEVLNKLSTEDQKFLMFTSILRRFNAEICAAVLADEEHTVDVCQSRLEHFERLNLFIIPLDTERNYYRYHHLFGDLLQVRLKAIYLKQIPDLHLRASLWLANEKQSKAALDHALAGHHYHWAADIIESNIHQHWKSSDLEFFQYISQIPDDILRTRPPLCLEYAWFGVITGQLSLVAAMVDAAEAVLKPVNHWQSEELNDKDKESIAFARVLRAYVKDFANQSNPLDPDLDQALRLAAEDQVAMRNSIAVVLGTLYFMEGDFIAAERYFLETIQRDKQANGTNAVPIAASRLARIYILQGRLPEAARILQENLLYVRDLGIRRFYVPGNLCVMLASIYREWGRSQDAEDLFEEGMSLFLSRPVPQSMLVGLAHFAELAMDQGRLEEAGKLIGQAEKILQKTNIHPETIQLLQSSQLRFWGLQNDTEEIKTWIDRMEYTLPQFDFRHELENLNRANAYLALNRQEDGLNLLKKILVEAEKAGRMNTTVSVLVLLAKYSSIEAGLSFLARAISMAEPSGYLNVFLKAGEPLWQRLEMLAQEFSTSGMQQKYLPYINRILAAASLQKKLLVNQTVLSGPVLPQGLVEPLTDRELEVLRLVADGLSNQEIADRLIISVRTAKKHIQNIYGKLAVEGRVQAINRANELHLLELK